MSDTEPKEQKGWTPEEESQIAGIMESTGCKRAEAIRKMRSSAKKGALATVSPKEVSYKLSAEKSRIIDSFIKFAGKWWKDTEELLKRSVEIDAIFDAKPRGVEIRGCTTKEQFYDKYTGISLRRIQQLRKAESTPVPAIEEPQPPAQIPEATQPEPCAEESGQPEETQPHHLNCEHGIELSSAQNGGCPRCAEDREREDEAERRHKQASDARKKAAVPRLAPPAPPTPSFAISLSPADIAANDLDTNVETAVNWIMSYQKFMSGNLWNEFLTRVVEELNGRASVPDKNKEEQCDYSEDKVAAMFAGGK
jgi:hypothetical protein